MHPVTADAFGSIARRVGADGFVLIDSPSNIVPLRRATTYLLMNRETGEYVTFYAREGWF